MTLGETTPKSKLPLNGFDGMQLVRERSGFFHPLTKTQ